MTATGWLAVGVALTLLAPAAPSRVERLAASGRLAGRGRRVDGRRADGQAPARAATLRWLRRRLGRARSEANRRQQLRGALAALAGELVAGGRPDAALTAAAAAGAAHAALFTRAAAAAAAGGDPAAVLREEPATTGLAAAWNLAEQAGAPLAGVVDRVAADLDAHEDQRRAVAVALAGPRSSAAVLAALPALGVLLGATMGGRPLAFLFGSRAGLLVGAAGLVLDLAGLWWMRRIVRWASR